MMDRLRTLLFGAVFYLVSVPIVLAVPLVGLLGTRAIRCYAIGWMRFHRWATGALLGIRRHYEGERHDGQYLYVAKHQAMYETLDLQLELGMPATVMKRELAQIPLWGWAARRYGVIVVDRSASAGALRRMLADARAAKAAGRSVLIFPEGTRVRPGETPPLQAGFAGLYKMLGLPVMPVALDSGRVWPRKGPKHSGTITFRFGAPIPPGLSRGEIEARVHAAINALEPSAPA
jgi:1-acyl-sn-glycerol-3-phosphate acyltransferase